MKTKKQIQARIDKLNKKLSLIAKHHDKYIELYKKSLSSNKLRDIFYQRTWKYKNKYTELYKTWTKMTYYKKGLEWVENEN